MDVLFLHSPFDLVASGQLAQKWARQILIHYSAADLAACLSLTRPRYAKAD